MLLANKIRDWSLIITAFTIPLPYAISINSVSIILFSISTLFIIVSQKKISNKKNIIILLFFFLIYATSGLWTEDKRQLGFEIEKKISLLILPIFIGSLNISQNLFNRLNIAFISSCLLLSLGILAYAFYFNITNTLPHFKFNWDYYSAEELVYRIKLHRVYLSIHILYAVIALLFLKSIKINTVIRHLLILFFIIFVALLASRMVIISLIPLLSTYFIIQFKVKKVNFLNFGVILLSVISVFFIILKIPKVNKMAKDFTLYKNYDEVKNVSDGNGVHIRYLIWKASLQAIKSSPVLGYGMGDSQLALNEQYKKMGFELGEKNPYNAHNQYIQTCLDAGLIGLSIFILLLLYLLYDAIIKHNEMYMLFLVLIVLCFLSENLLSNQKGIVFFSLFNSLLFFQVNNQNVIKK